MIFFFIFVCIFESLHIYCLHQFDGIDVLGYAHSDFLCITHGVDYGSLAVGYIAAGAQQLCIAEPLECVVRKILCFSSCCVYLFIGAKVVVILQKI